MAKASDDKNLGRHEAFYRAALQECTHLSRTTMPLLVFADVAAVLVQDDILIKDAVDLNSDFLACH